MQNIKLIREDKKLKQDEFARELGITQSYLSALETGRKNVTNKLVQKLFDFFNISPQWFYNDIGNMYNSSMGNIDGVNDGVNWNKTHTLNPHLNPHLSSDHMGDNYEGGIGGESQNTKTEKKLFPIVGKDQNYGYLIKSIKDLKETHPDLMDLQYKISELSALLIDAEKIYQTYIDGSLNGNIAAKSYLEYRNKRIGHLQTYTKYDKAINPFLLALKKFVIDFREFDSQNVIDASIDELIPRSE